MTDAARPSLPASAGPTTIDRRQFALGGTLLAASAATLVLKPRRVVSRLAPGMLDRAVPKQIGPYRYLSDEGLVLPPQDEITERIYDQVLTRVYQADGLPSMMMLIAYGSAQDYTLQAHLPEVCYPSSGYTLNALDRVKLVLHPGAPETGTFLSAARPDRIEQVLYWMRIGNRFPATLTQERLAVMGANLTGTLPDGILVRLSTLSPDMAVALPQLKAFNRMLLGAIGPDGRRLFGAGLPA